MRNDRRVGDCLCLNAQRATADQLRPKIQQCSHAVWRSLLAHAPLSGERFGPCGSSNWFLRSILVRGAREIARYELVDGMARRSSEKVRNDDDCWCGGRTVETTTAHLLRSAVLITCILLSPMATPTSQTIICKHFHVAS